MFVLNMVLLFIVKSAFSNTYIPMYIFHFTGNFIIKIQYKIIDGLFVLYHTEVPVEHRGHQLGFLIFQVCIDYVLLESDLLFCSVKTKSNNFRL